MLPEQTLQQEEKLSSPSPSRISKFLIFLEKNQIQLASGFLVVAILLSIGIFVFPKSEVEVLGAKKIKPTATPAYPSPTPTIIPTSTPKPSLKPSATVIPTATITPPPTTAPQTSGDIPAKVLDLSNWKLTLPTGSSESPTEIKQTELAAYKLDPWFVVEGGGVRFRAAVNAPTTSGSNYPRSELREMKNGGKDKASWSSTEGTHTMTIDQAITAKPLKKPHVVAGQIHDDDDDVIVIRLEGSSLYVNVDGDNKHTLTSNYNLGTRFTVKFEVNGGQTKVYYNGAHVYTLDKAYSGAYFKAGAYTQSNCSKEDVCSESNYGEVIIYSLSVSHS